MGHARPPRRGQSTKANRQRTTLRARTLPKDRSRAPISLPGIHLPKFASSSREEANFRALGPRLLLARPSRFLAGRSLHEALIDLAGAAERSQRARCERSAALGPRAPAETAETRLSKKSSVSCSRARLLLPDRCVGSFSDFVDVVCRERGAAL